MIRYRLRLQPELRYSFHVGAAPLTKETLEQLIQGALVHAIDDGGFGYQPIIDLQLDQGAIVKTGPPSQCSVWRRLQRFWIQRRQGRSSGSPARLAGRTCLSAGGGVGGRRVPAPVSATSER